MLNYDDIIHELCVTCDKWCLYLKIQFLPVIPFNDVIINVTDSYKKRNT